MKDWIKRRLPQYIVDKATGADESEVNSLPRELQDAFIHGTNEQAAQILRDNPQLGEAARELLYDLRGMSQRK